MWGTYKIEGAEITHIIAQSRAGLSLALKILGLDEAKVKVTLVAIG